MFSRTGKTHDFFSGQYALFQTGIQPSSCAILPSNKIINFTMQQVFLSGPPTKIEHFDWFSVAGNQQYGPLTFDEKFCWDLKIETFKESLLCETDLSLTIWGEQKCFLLHERKWCFQKFRWNNKWLQPAPVAYRMQQRKRKFFWQKTT